MRDDEPGTTAGLEPPRSSPGGEVSARMARLARRDNPPEMRLRRALHRLGLRYRVQMHVPGNRRRTIDIAFTRVRLAVFVDGCFWHACPAHGTDPRSNSEWWRWKLAKNVARDRDTDRLLASRGWSVIRIWEHEDPDAAAQRIHAFWLSRTTSDPVAPSTDM